MTETKESEKRQMSNPKILMIGGNGALGVYLKEEALKAGYRVDIVCLEDERSDRPELTFINHSGKDLGFMSGLVKNGYDAIVDFMIYPTLEEYVPFCDLYLASTGHYLFLSSYRVYAGAYPITEDSPRLLDVEKPADFVSEREYSIYKAQEEDYIRSTGYRNWTILRPSVTYSKNRFQLTVLEANVFVWRMLRGKTVVLPESAMDVEGTLSWAGDFGKSVVRLLFNEQAYGEAFTVSTAEHHSWREIAEIYRRIGGLKYVTVDDGTFLEGLYDGSAYHYQQLRYDRCFHRIIDNTKLLEATGRRQSDFMRLEDGLRMELASYDGSLYSGDRNDRMDRMLAAIPHDLRQHGKI